MPCAAGSLYKLSPDHTPGYLHGTYGVPADPLEATEMQRLCDGYFYSAKRTEASSDGDEADPSVAGNDLCTQPEPSCRPPPYTGFGDLEEVPGRCNMPEVSYHLRKAKLPWMRDYTSKLHSRGFVKLQELPRSEVIKMLLGTVGGCFLLFLLSEAYSLP